MNGVWALSGGIASGKSTVAAMLEARGAKVIDADQVAREVVEPGSEGLREIVAHFGDGVLHPDGQLNREALGQRVFGDEGERQTLNGILHPKIFMRSLEHMQAALAADPRPIFYDAALLVESGAYQNFDGLVIVAAALDNQMSRLMSRNGLSEKEAQERIASQLPMEKKVDVADHVIWNDHDLSHLESQVDTLLVRIASSSASTESLSD